jgi:cellobiose phosphorylase
MTHFETKYGYFSNDGNEYIIKTPRTPKPWVNILTNGTYGLVVSQTGGGFSWDTHSEFNRITRWHQDLIQDNWGKYIYIKNNKTGEVWNPAWMPVKTELDSYECRFGFGYTVFKSSYKGIEITLTMFVPNKHSLEIWNLEIENKSGEPADLSIFTYFEWVLGSSADHHREFHKTFLETWFEEDINAITATKRLWEIPLSDRGHWNIEYEYFGYFASNKKVSGYEGDKESFIGNYGSLQNPIAVKESKLTGKTGKWNDSIASLMVNVELNLNEKKETAFYLGLEKTKEEIRTTLANYLTSEQIKDELNKVKSNWETILGTMEINTPDKAMNLSVNKWFRYQAIAGRLWGRTAYYQQSGAFGFRDQLQDSLIYLAIDPTLTEKQIRLHARHQFEDGQVLHWWHPITETGLSTNMTDDLLWLPFLVFNYIDETANYELLNEVEPFYNSNQTGSIFDHIKRAIDKVLTRISDRGLALIGAGDWNDGLSAVGLDMKGESIWLTEFLYLILFRFEKILLKLNEADLANYYGKKASDLKNSFDKYAWDGEWFFRATKDNGQKIGSCENSEGKIYLNPQIWSVISGIADSQKQKEAMNAVSKNLLKKNGTLLLHPAYSIPDKYIGYLSRYSPGRRENGGVYTHAATWSVWAYALLKDNENAYEVCKRLNPILNGMNPDEYVAEPFVTPGNIDGTDSPNYGMGGWTWYTGSASWFVKVVVDWILGIRASEAGLIIDPCIPKEWDSYSVRRLFRNTVYNIKVNNDNHTGKNVKSIKVNGVEQSGNVVFVVSDEIVEVDVQLGE